ncbi:hypothetical protein CGLO_04467 [Colletotrichum gloeosporioides Cg-14]|uniref:Azaphilone pigments biosynthesis cluster protein L N-terminal domain-containing protein n=1 Tax=Colletotrichum gloeosporioides (strain Cg-14) TaxID=1237896 RepID=T0LUZ7_COLGC|nr:hypothetical protein CGLO_04467 [Colletotrichum gloeosporioides Cg-14]
MDPFSITLGVISLIGTSAKIIATLKDTVDSSRGIDRRLQMLISDVEMFKAMLESMKGTLESKEVRPHLLHAAGNLNSHWNTISVCIQDGEKMMSEFAVMLEKIDKSVDFMDAIRKVLRLKSSWEDISVFQTQLSSCRETISVSLHAVLIWNQVLSKDQNVFGGPLFLPVLSDLTAAIRRLAEDVNERMKVLENCVDSRDTESEMSTLNNMKNCVQSSAKIASTASSWALSTDAAESIAASDLYDIWPVQPDPNTLAWVASTSNIDLIRASVRSIPIISFSAADQSDSDDEMEAEIANIHMKRGREELLLGNFATAERYLQRGVRRLRSSRSQRQNLAVHADGLENLVTLYREQERWEETKDTIIERLALLSRTATADSTEVLKERLALADVLLKLHDPNDCTRALIPQFKACSIQLGSETVSVELVLWDSPGPMSETLFPDTIHNIADTINCIVLCFAVDEPDLIPDLDTLGIQIQDRIRAVSYVDCSAKTGEGVDQLMREVVLFSMKHRERMAELGTVKSIWRKGMGWLRSKP